MRLWFKKNKWKVIVPALIVLALAAAFWFGGDSPGSHGWTVSGPSPEAPVTEAPAPETPGAETPWPTAEISPSAGPSASPAATPEPSKAPVFATEAPSTAPALESPPASTGQPESTPVPEKAPEPTPEPEKELTCSISISCATLVGNDALDSDKAELVPQDGLLLPETQVTFSEGESVFDVLQRVCLEKGIQLEFVNSPIYRSAYIEGIGNLYEFDAGELSGWMYSVNGLFPNYGCSGYLLSGGDVIRWSYTCDFGYDIGDSSGSGNRP